MPKQATADMKEKLMLAPAKKKTNTATRPRRARSTTAKTAAKSAVSSKPRRSSPKAGAAATRRTITRRKQVEIPSILLEGDHPAPPAISGPGQKYSLGPTPPRQNFPGPETELPESYGTKKLFITARDPHWLYAHWDLTRQQQTELNGKSADSHLVLRIYPDKIEGHPLYEIHVHPESRHWFAHVEQAGNSYAAELGYYSPVGRWMRVAVSSSTMTPPDAVSPETETEFATIPFEFPFSRLLELIKSAVGENMSLAQAVEELRRSGHPELPKTVSAPAARWTPQQEQALARVISIDEMRRVWMGSLEITELIRRRLAQEMSSLGVSSLSSPFGGMERSKGFWFNVNAELIVYGATEPDAKVTLGGRQIKLRPDGSFSYRFSLPDGKYDLPAVAVSADGTDARAAELKFSRSTEYRGDVGTHPQDPSLKPPLPENV
jgi:uncharacterized protein